MSFFIPFKNFAGELLISQRRGNLRYTLTTKELVFQKPHTSYHIFLSDVIGLIPIQPHSMIPCSSHGDPWVAPNFYSQIYKISAQKLQIINRQGLHTLEDTDLLLPLNQRLIYQIQQCADFTLLTSV
ncbi:hypothetical protein [Hazenella coriacea]|uniref:Uncharacterized protein n=1 Tax=Hazenella coriacea TaxID=1179467 RepID=A0A4R3L5X7_9BACL|nr:hypothetical protein [Hazenella coriacea]TCS95093.1 hypothetical protein EDD58_103519 [Hazenella coriacea]